MIMRSYCHRIIKNILAILCQSHAPFPGLIATIMVIPIHISIRRTPYYYFYNTCFLYRKKLQIYVYILIEI